ncbi:hypothetical protein JMJ77_0000958, partial [Colletotrichum scovillei]
MSPYRGHAVVTVPLVYQSAPMGHQSENP